MFGDNFLQGFLEETRELLEKLEGDLLELEQNPDNIDNISAVFRTFHTIKGSSSMFGFDEIARFTHHIENILDLARESKIKVDTNITTLILKSKDHIQNLLEATDIEILKPKTEEIITLAKSILDGGAPETQKTVDTAPAQDTNQKEDEAEDSEEGEKWYYVYFRPSPDFYFTGSKPERNLSELKSSCSRFYVNVTTEFPAIKEFTPENCYYTWNYLLLTDQPKSDIEDIFIFVQDYATIKIETVQKMGSKNDLEFITFIDRLSENGINTNMVKFTDLSEQGSEKKEEALPVEKKEEQKTTSITPKPTTAVVQQNAPPTPQQQKPKPQPASTANTSIRVASDKLDNLVDMVGQLVTIDASIKQRVLALKDSELEQITEQLDRLVDDMRDLTMNIRMMPIGNTFEKFRRLVRDLSMELGKKIDLVTEGSDTELDKNVIEKINEPLVHLIRNSVDHGIEMPQDRIDSGKPETGTIKLKASYSGASVVIAIEDDGKGINKNVIFAKAVEKGIVNPDANLTDNQIYELIFAAGFSTAEKVTSVSGRGVGMDVVRREIESLRGKVNVESQLGKGSKMLLTLPLTLAIIEGLLVKIDNDSYTIPLSAVESCIDHEDAEEEGEELDENDNNNSIILKNKKAHQQGRNIIYHRGETIPYVKLRDLLQYKEKSKEREQVVVIQNRHGKSGLVVDKVIGEYQTVIKNLGEFYKNVDGVMGASILGDGTVSLILDLDMISGIAIKQENSYIQKVSRRTFSD